MKKYILYSLALAACMSFSSCNQFLDENPKDQLPKEEIAKSPELVYITTVASLYNLVGANSGGAGLQGTDRGIYDLNTFTTDEAMIPKRGGDWGDGGLWINLYQHNWGTKNDLIKSSWDYLYKVIAKCNESLVDLDYYASIATTDKMKEELASYKSEITVLRAMYYYYLLDMYARVPIVTSPTQKLNEVKQADRKEVFDFVVKELQDNVALLSPAHSNLQGLYYGRMTQPVGYFLLAKLMMNAEVYADNNWTDATKVDGKTLMFTVDGKQLNAWEATIAYANKITDLGYSLETNFVNNFAVDNEKSTENIFTIPMDPIAYKNEFYYLIRSRHYSHAKAFGQGGWNGACGTKEVLDAFAYGSNKQDPRFAASYYYGKVKGPNNQFVKTDDGKELEYMPTEIALDLSNMPGEKVGGARMKKYELDKNATTDGKLQRNDIVLFRYADVVLMIAEAKVRNGQDGTAEINLIRERAGATLDSKADLESILKERMLEFSWEGLRRQDLIRFGQFTRTYTDRPQLPGEQSGYTTVFPIHEDILSLSNGNFTQNPGYGQNK